jgi:hypothetical protein
MPKSENLPSQNGLTSRQIKFVDLWVVQGTNRNAGKLARMAGYSDLNADSAASHLLRDDKILNEIKRRAISTLTSEVVNCVNTMTYLRDGPGVDDAVRLKAATALLDRAIPLARLHQVDVNVNVHEDREDVVQELHDIFRRRGDPIPTRLEQSTKFFEPGTFDRDRPRQPTIEHEDPEDVAEEEWMSDPA